MRRTITPEMYRKRQALRVRYSTARLLSEYMGPLMLHLDGSYWYGDSPSDYKPKPEDSIECLTRN